MGTKNNLSRNDDYRSKRHRRRKMQRILEKDPKLLEYLVNQMMVNNSTPEGYDNPPEQSVEPDDDESSKE